VPYINPVYYLFYFQYVSLETFSTNLVNFAKKSPAVKAGLSLILSC
jgi:hypothetical protein